LSDIRDDILEAYQDGNDLGYIIVKFNITHKRVTDILHTYKEQSRIKRTFTDEFKKVIADRDASGVSRRQIATELNINPNTVKKACEQFGQANKEKATSDNEYTRIDGKFGSDKCIGCESKNVNEVDLGTVYCKDCGEEYIIKSDHALKINWEYLD
jgi:predicted RNA-binding Zn-ribbon protein involved in translation (DUF1610 family)/DNA-binding transcriptional regulator YiaG